MSELKPMSAADYRTNAEKVNAQRPTEIVKLTSGSVFELRRPNLEAYMVTGRLPHSLVQEGLRAWKRGQVTTEELTDDQAIDALIFMREIVHDCTVTPKFVEFATNDNEIGASDMLKEDFDEIFDWAMHYKGVAGIGGLRTFRSGRTQRVNQDRPNRKKRRDARKHAPETANAIQ